jgi:hypothetical protein
MKRRMSAALALTAAGFSLNPASARAETATQVMSKSCPAAFAADKNGLEKRAASLYYDCYHQLSDPHARDLAHLSYLQSLSRSISPSERRGAMIEVYTLIVNGAGDLAASTAFPDVRKAALFMQSEATRMLNQLESASP